MQTKIETLLNAKGREVWSVPVTATIHEAIGTMADKRVEALVVLSEQKLAGILTERDCARRVLLDGKDPTTVHAHEVMTSPVVAVTEAHTIGDCLRILSEGGFAHLPVLNGDVVCGVVSMGDLVSWMVREQHETITQLEGYITGQYPG